MRCTSRERARPSALEGIGTLLGVASLVASLIAISACRRGESHAELGVVSASARPAASAPRVRVPHFVGRRRSFTVADVDLRVVDLHMSRALDRVLHEDRAELVVNGGFFDARGEPVGLVVSQGEELSPLKADLSGGVLAVDRERAQLFATEAFAGSAPWFAIQCRPRLVVQSLVNIHSDAGPRAARTAICLRDSGRTLEFVVAEQAPDRPGPTLFELATELSADGCEDALNLDGGPSTGWASSTDAGVDFVEPRAPVRHALVVTRRVARSGGSR